MVGGWPDFWPESELAQACPLAQLVPAAVDVAGVQPGCPPTTRVQARDLSGLPLARAFPRDAQDPGRISSSAEHPAPGSRALVFAGVTSAGLIRGLSRRRLGAGR